MKILSLPLVLGALCVPAQAQLCSQAVVGSNSVSQSRFGQSVSLTSNRAIVGAYGENNSDGAAYIYDLDAMGQWNQVARLAPPNPGQGGQFGWDVAIQGNTCVVGAPLDDSAYGPVADTGAAYVYQYNGSQWLLEQRLEPTGLTPDTRYGLSVGYYNQGIVVGAPKLAVLGQLNVGSAFVYRHGAGVWNLEGQLLPETLGSNQWFGTSVSIYDLTIAVGAPYESNAFVEQGGAYTFKRLPNTTWIQDVHVYHPSPNTQDYFGIAVDVFGNRLVVGCEYDDPNGSNSGSAHIFGRPNATGLWSFEQTLTPSFANSNDTFGNAVAMTAGELIVSARGSDLAGPETGSAFVFRRNPGSGVWTEAYAVTAPVASFGDVFSNDVDIYLGEALIGMSGEDGPNGTITQQGAAHFFNVSSVDCNGNGYPDECDVANGLSLDCNGNGLPDDCDIANGVAQDCNMNGIPDSCDVASGFSTDCNLNGIPDECDLSSGASQDCNANGLIDECDLANGFSIDLNGNLVPDECETLGLVYCNPAAPNSASSSGASLSAIGSGTVAGNDVLFFANSLPTNQYAILVSGQTAGYTPSRVVPRGSCAWAARSAGTKSKWPSRAAWAPCRSPWTSSTCRRPTRPSWFCRVKPGTSKPGTAMCSTGSR